MSAHAEHTRTPPRGHSVLWIVIGIVGGLVVLISVAFYLVVAVAFGIADRAQPTVGEAYTAAQHYYQAIQQHDYTTAYTYVAPHATMTVDGQANVIDSAATLTSIAQSTDQKNGAVTAYTPTDGNFEQGKQVVDMTMRVTRGAGSYDVHIQIGLANGKWQILHSDGI